MKNLFPGMDLQLFAEGDGGAAGTGVAGMDAASQTGDKAGTDAVGAPDAVAQEDRAAKFEALIKGEYKDLYNKRVQDTVRNRLKGTQETVDKYTALSPVLDMLAHKYGVDASDVKALTKAIEDDDAFYEQEALEKGITVKQLKEIRKMERENAELKRQMDQARVQQHRDQMYAAWMQQAQEAKKVYPSFDLEAEIANPQFFGLVSNNIDLKTAYEVVHKDEIIPAAMQFAMKTAETKLASKVAANGARPNEIGSGAQGASVTKYNVAGMTRAEREDIIRRVRMGEKITF